MRKKAVTKEMIVKQGLTIIEMEGIEQCSVRKMAKELGIGVGTIYNYFESHDAFILEAFNMSWNDTIQKINVIATGDSRVEEKIISIFSVTYEDVIKRNNLGTKLYTMCQSVNKPYFTSVSDRYKNIIDEILTGHISDDMRGATVDWIVAVIFNHVKHKKPVSKGDRLVIQQLLTES